MSIALSQLVQSLLERVEKIEQGNESDLLARIEKLEGEIKAMKARMGKKPPE